MNLGLVGFNPDSLGPIHVVTLELLHGNQRVIEAVTDLDQATATWKKYVQEAAEIPVEHADDVPSRYRLFTVKLDLIEHTEN